ncbi:hypothetical protein FQN49_002490 [Arthroderma sp. PD_2]|nr:hypothetical protein FQN49_002490 [Arthroderma sp. PD_2]
MAQDTMRSPRRKSRLFDYERFRFTPVATSKKAPRLWDRKATTPVLPRSRTQKIWKRYLASTSLESEDMRDTDTFCTEINLAATLAALRGVKRLRLAQTGDYERGRSFLETKWETETGERRRKYVAPAEEGEGVVDSAGTTATTATSADFLVRGNSGCEDIGPLDDEVCSSPCNNPGDTPQLEDTSSSEETALEAVTPPEERTMAVDINQQKTTPTLPNTSPEERGDTEEETYFDAVTEPMAAGPEQGEKPRRNVSILDGDDAELISDFLSQARAKRAALTPMKGDASVDRVPESPTPNPRRALEAMDGNSPRSHRRLASPDKLQPPNFYFARRPSRGEPPRPLEAVWEGNCMLLKPVVEISVEHERHAPRIPDQIPMRRRKGTEFVFMQRTDDQQTALLTKANTRLNKGTRPPHKLLPILNKAIADLEKGRGQEEGQQRHQADQSKKQVKWNDDALIEYCGHNIPEFDAEVYQNSQTLERCLRSSTRRNTSKKQEPVDGTDKKKSEGPTPFLAPVSIPAPATPYRSTPVPRKMRKLVGAKHLDVHPNEGESPPVTRINLSMKASTVFPGTPLRHKKTFSLAQSVPRTLSLKPTKPSTSSSASGSGVSYPTVLLRKQTKS